MIEPIALVNAFTAACAVVAAILTLTQTYLILAGKKKRSRQKDNDAGENMGDANDGS